MDWYAHPPEMLDWLKARGCYWEKICAPPGALILWDSVCPPSVPLSLPSPQPPPTNSTEVLQRLVHYGAIPLSNNARVAACAFTPLRYLPSASQLTIPSIPFPPDVCYKPASLASDEVYDTRKHNIENLKGTSHDPIVFRSRVSFPTHI